MSHIQVHLRETSIVFAETDVIVCPIDPDLNLSNYRLSRELSENAPALQERLVRQQPNGARYYEHIHLSADSDELQFKEILFIVCAPYLGIYSEQKLFEAFERLLCTAEQIHAVSIAFPAVGCGQLKYPLETVIIQLLRASDLHQSSSSSSLRKVLFATPNAMDVQEFIRIKSKYDEAKLQSTKNVISKRPIKSTPDPCVYYLHEKYSMVLTITGNKNYPRSDNCLHLLFEMVHLRNKKTKIEKEDWRLKKKDLVKNDMRDVSEDLLAQLFLSAHDETATIFITTEQKDKERLREFANVVVKAFKLWCDNCISGIVREVVVHIEENLLETFCPAVLEALYPIAKPLSSSSLETARPQKRVDGLPDAWKLGDDSNLISLNPDTTEYQEVESEFMHTAGASAEAVVKIERIQDPHLWRQFEACEVKVMENLRSSKYPVSRRLWHGTSAAVVSKMVNGSDYRFFDRSYCGDQALYGKGCYFATDASYAAQPQYAVRNPDGTAHVFLAQVLTGCFTTGTPEMKEVPRRQGTEGLFFDSTVDNELDPCIFVTFHDTHAYPLYLVTFH